MGFEGWVFEFEAARIIASICPPHVFACAAAVRPGVDVVMGVEP